MQSLIKGWSQAGVHPDLEDFAEQYQHRISVVLYKSFITLQVSRQKIGDLLNNFEPAWLSVVHVPLICKCNHTFVSWPTNHKTIWLTVKNSLIAL